MVTGSNPSGGMPPGVGYDAAMAYEFGLHYVMNMIEPAARHLNFFWGGVRNSWNVLHPQCSILPRLVALNSLHKLPIMASKWKKTCIQHLVACLAI